MDRTILHSDMNNCYAAIELLHHPELRGRPLAVGGDPEARHGIVLAKDPLAKRSGVKTGMALWQASLVCPDIVFVPPHMDLYLRFSRLAREIYSEYTDRQEAFGIDEAWLDVSASVSIKGDGASIAEEIRRRIKDELGITVSIGVSWNKIFAKLGSDYRKPDAVTVIDRGNYRRVTRPLPAGDLLYVGRATRQKLASRGIRTIGALADTDPLLLEDMLGKAAYILHAFANGEDRTPVDTEDTEPPIRSIGNSTTAPRDLTDEDDVRIVIYLLAESVAARLRENGFMCTTVEISVRDRDLHSFTRQKKLSAATDITSEIAVSAMDLFMLHCTRKKPIRSLGVRACGLVDVGFPVQEDLFTDPVFREKRRLLDAAVDNIRSRFGYYSIQRGLMYRDRLLSSVNAKEDHTVHPHGYMERGNRTGVFEFDEDRRLG